LQNRERPRVHLSTLDTQTKQLDSRLRPAVSHSTTRRIGDDEQPTNFEKWSRAFRGYCWRAKSARHHEIEGMAMAGLPPRLLCPLGNDLNTVSKSKYLNSGQKILRPAAPPVEKCDRELWPGRRDHKTRQSATASKIKDTGRGNDKIDRNREKRPSLADMRFNRRFADDSKVLRLHQSCGDPRVKCIHEERLPHRKATAR